MDEHSRRNLEHTVAEATALRRGLVDRKLTSPDETADLLLRMLADSLAVWCGQARNKLNDGDDDGSDLLPSDVERS